MSEVATVGIVVVGDEIVQGRIVDTHSSSLSRALTERGYRVALHVAVGDDEGALSATLRAVSDAENPPQALIITGGLGPTQDDRTRDEVASFLGEALEFREEAWERITSLFERLKLNPVPGNRSQAFFPESAREIPNTHGTAPGFFVPRGAAGWWVLPGVPRELHALLDEVVFPELAELLPVPPPPGGEVLRFFGIPESRLDTWLLEELAAQQVPGRYPIRVSQGEIDVRLPPTATLEARARERFGTRFLGTGEETLAERLVAKAAAAGLVLTTAESCTGGLLGGAITAVPGSSDVFRGGWVVYSDEWKHEHLGVSREILATHGAVSAATAVALAAGARRRAEADVAVAITGIAGPGGAREGKPVGTTFLGLSLAAGSAGSEATLWRRFRFPGGRQDVRRAAVAQALFALWCGVAGTAPPDWCADSGQEPEPDLPKI